MKNADFIWDFIIDPLNLAKKAQVGVDLTAFSISKVGAFSSGTVYSDASMEAHSLKTELASYHDLPIPSLIERIPLDMWHLNPGVYEIMFDQGLKQLPANITAFIHQRSSVGRNGSLIMSSVYDPGFKTERIGAFLYVHTPINIERHARVAQIVFHENDPVGQLYDGQWQNK